MRALLSAMALLLTPAIGRAQTPRDPAPPLRIASQSRPSESERELRARVIALLDQDKGDVSQLPPESVHVLEQVLNAQSNRPERRLRAVAALGRINAADASDKLRTILKEKGIAAPYRAAAAMALARREGRAAVTELQPALGDPQLELRLGVARALGYLGGPDARSAVEDRIAKEPDAKVREELQQIVSRMNP